MLNCFSNNARWREIDCGSLQRVAHLCIGGALFADLRMLLRLLVLLARLLERMSDQVCAAGLLRE